MKKYFTLLVVCVVVFGISPRVHADSAPDRPLCSETEDYTVSPSKAVIPTCKAIGRIFNLTNSPEFQQKIYILEHISERGGSEYYRIHKDGPIDQPHGTGADLIAIDKSYFDSHGGLSGVFKEKTVVDPDFGNATVMSPVNEADFSQNTFPIVVARNDSDSGQDYGAFLDTVPSSPFVNVTNAYYIYDQESTISPVTAKEMVYIPLDFVQDEGKKKLVVYKSKIIFTLDNNKKSEKVYPVPTMEELKTPVVAPGSATPTAPTESLFIYILKTIFHFFRI